MSFWLTRLTAHLHQKQMIVIYVNIITIVIYVDIITVSA